ncbi:MAG: transposase [Bacteroidetes bacterium]|nr:transposase [Bacteroidota bacterium]
MSQPSGQHPSHKGKLKIDATVADQLIEYPTDLKLLNQARLESERIIDLLYQRSDRKIKPRTYRRVAQKHYLALAKKRKKSQKALRKGIGRQLRYLRRNIQTIDALFEELPKKPFPLRFRDLKLFWVIRLLYDQQLYMYQHRVKSHPDRIVNLYQPYVRPIPRGKDKGKTEFGAKLGVSEVDGFCRIDHLSWDAYNECTDLINQVEAYQDLYGYDPEVVLADQIYLTRANRAWLKSRGIRHIGLPLGRPKALSAYAKRKLRNERNMRNHIEGKFGQGKNAYGLTRIRARRADTSESWIAAIFTVLNLRRWLKILPENPIQCYFEILTLDAKRIYRSQGPLPEVLGLDRNQEAIRSPIYLGVLGLRVASLRGLFQQTLTKFNMSLFLISR